MIFVDVNVLVYAYRKDVANRERCAAVVQEMVNSEQPYWVSDLVLSGFIRILTNKRIFKDPAPLDRAMAIATNLRDQPNARQLAPGARHWSIFAELCLGSGAEGNLITDAWFAAMALERDAEWVSTDRDFARFPGLRWRNPLDE